MSHCFGVYSRPFGVPRFWSYIATLRSVVTLLKKVLEIGDDRRRSWLELALELPKEPLEFVSFNRGEREFVRGALRCVCWERRNFRI